MNWNPFRRPSALETARLSVEKPEKDPSAGAGATKKSKPSGPPTDSVLRQHFNSQIYARVIETIGIFNPKTVTIGTRLLMRNDPDVHFGTAALRAPIINGQFSVESRDEKIKAFVEAQFRVHYRAIARSASLGIGLGYQVTEKVWKAGPTTIEIENKVGGEKETVKIPIAWTFDRFKSIDPRTITLHVDDQTDEWDGVAEYTPLVESSKPPMSLVGPDRVALYVNDKDSEFGKLSGRPLLNVAYSDWWDKSAISMYANRYFETKGDPSMIGRAALDTILDADGVKVDGLGFIGGILKLLKGGNGVVLPGHKDEKGNYLYDVNFLKDDKRGDLFESYLRYKSSQILQGLLTPPRVGGAHAGSGLGTKDAGVQQDLQSEFLESLLYDFFEYLNEQYVKPLVIYNFGLEAWEESKTRLVSAGLSAGVKTLLKEVLLMAFNQQTSLGNGKRLPLFQLVDVPAILKELDVPAPSPEDLAELEAEQEEANKAADEMQQAAVDAGGAPGKKPAPAVDEGLSRGMGYEHLGEIRTETYKAELLKIEERFRKSFADWEAKRTLELAKATAASPAPAPAPAAPTTIETHLHIDKGAIPVNVAPAAVTFNAGDTHVDAPAAPIVNQEIHHHHETTIGAALELKPADKKTVVIKGPDGEESTATITRIDPESKKPNAP